MREEFLMIKYHKKHECWWPSNGRNDVKDIEFLQMTLPSMDNAIDLCKKHKLCLQAGGHVGLWPLRLAKSFETVITFEPQDELFECLLHNVKNVDNIDPHCAALGQCEGRAMMLLKGNAAVGRVDAAGTVDVRMVSIDSLELDQCDALFLDVEGYEVEVLRGAVDTIKRYRPIIQVEMLPRVRVEIDKFLTGIGYRFNRRAGKDAIYVNTKR